MEHTLSVKPSISSEQAQRLRGLAVYAVVVSLAFMKPLALLARYAYATDLYSHILLIPVISGYLIWQRRRETLPPISASLALAVIPAALGFIALTAFFSLDRRGALSEACDSLSLTIPAWLCFLCAGVFTFLGSRWLRTFAFPAAFLVFMIPFPGFVRDGLETFLQHASADAAAILFAMTGTTVYREGLVFHLPGLVIQVAQECSGVRSSLVLFITSFVAALWFLRSTWSRATLVLVVIPLGILRNGFRILTISLLTVHVDPGIIDSPLHHRGGPIFFVLSLIPFFGILWWLHRRERRVQSPTDAKKS